MPTRLGCCPHSPLALSQILLFNSPGVSRWQGLRRCECVCVFTFNASHTHSVRCHSQGLGTDWAGLKRLYNLVLTLYSCPLVCSTSESVCECVWVCVQECMQVAVYIPKMAQLCTAEHTHTNQQVNCSPALFWTKTHMKLSYPIHYKQAPPPTSPPSDKQNSAQSRDTKRHQRGSQHKKKIGRGQHMSSQRTTPHKTTVPAKHIGSLQQLRRGVAWRGVQLCVHACDAFYCTVCECVCTRPVSRTIPHKWR